MPNFTLPIINLQSRPLDILLYGLGLRLSHLSKSNNDKFTKLLSDKRVCILFTGGLVSRYYRFVDGHFGQALGAVKDPDLTIAFKDEKTGVSLISQGDVTALMRAVQDGDVVITGDYKLIMWLSSVIKEATKIDEPYQSYLNKAKPYLKKLKSYLPR